MNHAHISFSLLLLLVLTNILLGCSREPAAGDPVVDLPSQFTSDFAEGALSDVLQKAISEEDVLLLDRVAWSTGQEEVRKNAEKALLPIIDDWQKRFVRSVEQRTAAIPAGGIAFGSEMAEHDYIRGEVLIQLDDADSPQGVKVVLGGTRVDRFSLNAEYCILVRDDVAAGEYRVPFTLLVSIPDESSRPSQISIVVLITVEDHGFSVNDVYKTYAQMCIHERQRVELSRSASEKLDNLSQAFLDGYHFAARDELPTVRAIQQRAKRHSRAAGVYEAHLHLLSNSGNSNVSTAALRCTKIIRSVLPQWTSEKDAATSGMEVQSPATLQTVSLTNVPVAVSVDPVAGFIVDVNPKTVNVEISGPADIVNHLALETVQPKVNCAGLSPDSVYTLPVFKELGSNVRVTIDPLVVTVGIRAE